MNIKKERSHKCNITVPQRSNKISTSIMSSMSMILYTQT